MGPFAGYQRNAAAMLGVMAKHRAAVGNIEHTDVGSRGSRCPRAAAPGTTRWISARCHGYRNAQATVLAPTGTISFMMDCDTTGVEPDFSLVKSKKLVGGGEITIVNKTVPMALEKLGYAPTEGGEIVAFVDERNTMIGAPYVKAEHYPVFDCAIGERAIHYMGHVKMMGAVQPFISGAISKTVNLPETVTVDDVAEAAQGRVAARRQGDRDLPRQLQGGAAAVRQEDKDAAVAVPPVPLTLRRRLPEDRTEVGRKFQVGDYEGYLHVGLYEDGTPGDIFCDVAKVGTTLQGLVNSLMISVSLGLQYGVPLEVYVSKFAHMRFEPAGLTNDADIRTAKSIVDYIFRWMGKKFLTVDQQEEIGILSPEVRARLAQGYANGGRCPVGTRPRPRRRTQLLRARPRCSTPGRTRSSAPSAAAGWCGPAPATRAGTAGLNTGCSWRP